MGYLFGSSICGRTKLNQSSGYDDFVSVDPPVLCEQRGNSVVVITMMNTVDD